MAFPTSVNAQITDELVQAVASSSTDINEENARKVVGLVVEHLASKNVLLKDTSVPVPKRVTRDDLRQAAEAARAKTPSRHFSGDQLDFQELVIDAISAAEGQSNDTDRFNVFKQTLENSLNQHGWTGGGYILGNNMTSDYSIDTSGPMAITAMFGGDSRMYIASGYKSS